MLKEIYIKNLAVISKVMGISVDEILVFSSVTKEGKDDLLSAIEACLESIADSDSSFELD